LELFIGGDHEILCLMRAHWWLWGCENWVFCTCFLPTNV